MRSIATPLLLAAALALSPAIATAQPTTALVDPEFPTITVTTLNNPAPGGLYLGDYFPFAGVGLVRFVMILDSNARPLYSKRVKTDALDFKRHADGRLSYFDDETKQYYVMDTTYAVVDSVKCANGYQTDAHELLLTDNGHWLLLGVDTRKVDMRPLVTGGNANATVIGAVIQELDAQKNLVFEWNSFDHIPITDATHENMRAATIDYIHPNSLEIDYDGNLLVSSRNTDDITKINRTDGSVIWRLGGKKNQFTFVNDPIGFSHQHTFRLLPNGNYILFDNGNFHTPQFSRAVEYRLDQAAKTATLVWQYRHTPDIYSAAMGSVQRLENGNTLIGWGIQPVVTEVRPDGTTALELRLPNGRVSYRAFKGPVAPPVVRTRLVSPLDMASPVELTPLLTWEPAEDATGYHLQVSMDSLFQTIVYENLSSPGTEIRMDSLEYSTRYFWRVMPVGTAARPLWTNVWSFTTEAPIVYMTLKSPLLGAQEVPLAPLLEWNPLAGAISYRLQVSKLDPFLSSPFIDTVLTTTSFRLDSLLLRTKYYWRVQPTFAGGTINWSQIWFFETQARPVAPGLQPLAPLHNARITSDSIRFVWERVGDWKGSTVYHLEIGTDPTFQVRSVDSMLTETFAVISTSRFNPATYWWRVSATDTAGATLTTTARDFERATTSSVDLPSTGSSLDVVSLTPNPAGSLVSIRFDLPRRMPVQLSIYDQKGSLLVQLLDRQLESGPHAVPVDIASLPAGVYHCLLATPDGQRSRMLVVTR